MLRSLGKWTNGLDTTRLGAAGSRGATGLRNKERLKTGAGRAGCETWPPEFSCSYVRFILPTTGTPLSIKYSSNLDDCLIMP